MRILLTGSGGFIGKHLKNYFGEDVLCTPRSAELNLLDKSAVSHYLTENKIDFIIHSASCGVRILPQATLEEVAAPNLQMFDNLAATNIPMLSIGSGAEYDKRQNLHKVKENDFGRSIPADPYGFSKYQISRHIEGLNHVCNLRLFSIYGPGEHSSRVTSYILQQISKHEPICLHQNVVYDIIYIDDFCRIVQHFVKNFPKEKFINISPVQSISIVDLAKLTLRQWGMELPITTQIPGLNNEYTGDNSLLLTLFPSITFTSYADGMRQFSEIWRKNLCLKTN